MNIALILIGLLYLLTNSLSYADAPIAEPLATLQQGIQAQDSESRLPSTPLEALLNSFNVYYLNAPWIIEESLALTPMEFTHAWKRIVTLLTIESNRSSYFDLNNEINKSDYWKRCVRQCKVYDDWLSLLYADLTTDELVIQQKKMRLPAYCIAIFEFWHVANSKTNQETDFYQFYAFYLDCLTHLFDEYIASVKEFASDKAICHAYWKLATACLSKLEALLARLKGSARYDRYHLAVTKLRGVKRLGDEHRLFAS